MHTLRLLHKQLSQTQGIYTTTELFNNQALAFLLFIAHLGLQTLLVPDYPIPSQDQAFIALQKAIYTNCLGSYRLTLHVAVS